ncbi:MAG: RCC1 domain-containing protein [Polyangiales bacterium]
MLTSTALQGCADEAKGATIVVQLQTDLVPIEEFDSAELSLWSLSDARTAKRLDVPIQQDSFYPAALLGELEGVTAGDYRLTVLLQSQALGRTVAERPVLLTVQNNVAVPVPVTRSCLNVYCPEGQACLGGRCVDPRCALEHFEWCGEARECNADSDCQPAAACAMGHCRQGVCWAVPRSDQDAEGCDPQSQWCHPESQCLARSLLEPAARTPTAASCADGIQNGDESSIDCGGSCGACGDGASCSAPGDCTSAVCTGGTCQAPSCSDGVQNGGETGLDCGGPCSSCAVTVVALKAVRQVTCALKSNGEVYCWGRNLNAQISGDGSTASPQRDPIQPQMGFAGAAIAVNTGNAFSCAVASGGQAYCWGGALFSGQDAAPATAVSGATNLSQSWGSKSFACGVTASGGVLCWGRGYFGGSTNAAVSVAGLSNVQALGLGDDHACALHTDSTVSCWGDNTYGQLGDGSNTPTAAPVTVIGIHDATAIAASRWYNCALHAGGTVSCWGRNDLGQLGDGSYNPSNLPLAIAGLTNVTHISAGDDHICARTSAGALHCWGRGYGNTPQQVYSVGVALPSMGERFSCVLMDDRVTVQCWGANAFGECGPGVTGSHVGTPNSFAIP